MSEEIANKATRAASGGAVAGISFGSALAITISWTANKSILWAMIHGILGWVYVIYYALKYQ